MKYLGRPLYDHRAVPSIGVLLTNVGTPPSPTARGLRPFLAEFLSDRRVVEWPTLLWKPILHGILLNTRPRKSARLYQRIWTAEGSPLLVTVTRQAKALQETLDSILPVPIRVSFGMRYGRPSISKALRELHDAGVDRLLVFPLFPQYSATTTATSFDAVFEELTRWRWVPALRTITQYHDRPDYISAVASSIQRQWQETGRPQRLLFSFHSIPHSYFLKGDPYYCHCQKTARLIANKLALKDEEWDVSFQSRLGPQQWLEPDTADTLTAWGKQNLGHLDVVCPGFSADCLETTDEIGHEGRLEFQNAGGGKFHYIPALNDHPDHLLFLATIVAENLQGWLTQVGPDAGLEGRVKVHRERLGINNEQ